MSFDQAQYHRDRIRTLERDLAGAQATRDHLVRVLANVIVDMDARRGIDLLSQDEFMQMLAQDQNGAA